MSSSISLYRKYRPKNFAEIEGQDFVVRTLKNSIINNKLNHAYILSGPRGIGKTSIAKIFAKAVNCLNPNNGDCCNECKNCLLISSNTTLDVVEMDAASNNGVADIRNLIDNVNYLPIDLNYKVYIIDEAHMLTNGAWNALLKTIEEPPKHLIFIFATTESYKIPLTIMSRCQKYTLSNLSIYELEKTIQRICEIEGIQITTDASKKLAAISDGSARDCLTFLGQLDTFTNSNITIDDINQVFGLLDIQQKFELISNVINSRFDKVISSIQEYEIKGIDFYQLGIEIVQILFDKLVYEKTHNDNLLQVLTRLNLSFISVQPKFLIKMIEVWQDGIFKMKVNSNQKFYFELTCLSSIKIFDFDNLPNLNTQTKPFENNLINKREIKPQDNNTIVNKPIVENRVDIKNVKKLKDDDFINVEANDVITTKVLGNENEVTDINYVKVGKKDEDKSLKKLSEAVEESKNSNDFFNEEIKSIEDKIVTPDDFDVSKIIESSMTTKPYVVEDKQQKNQSNKKTKDKQINELDLTQEENLFNMSFDDYQESAKEIGKAIENATNIENTVKQNDQKVISKKQEIINEFKNNLKSVATIIPKQKVDDNKQENVLENNQKVENNNQNNTIDIIVDDNFTSKKEKQKEAEKQKIVSDLKTIKINEYTQEEKREIFFKIADNASTNTKEKVSTIFNSLKGKIAKSIEEGYLVNADKILFASNHGVVIIYDEIISCKNLNANSHHINFLKYIEEKFGSVYLFLAITKNEAQEFTNLYKEHLKTKNKLEDIKIDILLDTLNKKETIKDIAMNMLDDLIEEEN